MSASRNDAELKVLLEAYDQALARGQAAEANRLLAQARGLAPNHEAVLNAQAIAALRAGNPAAGRELLERAVKRNARAVGLWINLAVACRDLGDAPAERSALDRALELEPRELLALLQKAALLERLGEQFEAAGLYQAALSVAPPAAQLAPPVKRLLDHALECVRAEAARMDQQLSAALGPVRAAHEPQPRFELGLAALLGKSRIYPSLSTVLQVPFLAAIPFYDRALFPWLGELEAETEALAAEAAAVLAEAPTGWVPFVDFGDAVPLDDWKGLNRAAQWSAFYLWRDGAPVEANLARCPAAAALLARLPLADLPGNAPNVYFSVLSPRTRIPPHNGVSNVRAIVHLPLIVPGSECRLRVGSEVRELQRGEAYAFDDSIEHEAVNPSGEPRVVLVLDAWNPHLTEAERALARTTFTAAAAYAGRRSMFAGCL